ncbi:peptidase inhibitor family I36 protein [Rathayibacter sp. VKM Ac-2760]|uniref:peptidase inhibitor family I36 protein n=1 Tax=Rathayibacter sp. VKM Ac-2760 TaxID=2609253 RepID=UPI0013171529|nr:peptidase inhibitor family I36 protein [Rathayibacter sp. VKM Ac-2760]QHC57532.1 hypothetical protein GSU72_02235 [Rathayibacter sp. VKM Ac-2760]
MKKILFDVLAGASAIGLALAGAQAANAVTLYDSANYTGPSFTATSATSVGSLADRASSLTNGGRKVYYEDENRMGRSVSLDGNYNSLQAISTNLHFGETWNDRISSF